MTPPEQANKELSQKPKRYVRPINELWEMWKPRVKMHIYPFTYAVYEDIEHVMTNLTSYDHERWAAAFSAVAQPYEEKAAQAEKVGDAQSAKENYFEHTNITDSPDTQQLIRREKKKLTENHRKLYLRLQPISIFH